MTDHAGDLDPWMRVIGRPDDLGQFIMDMTLASIPYATSPTHPFQNQVIGIPNTIHDASISKGASMAVPIMEATIPTPCHRHGMGPDFG
jgi:hypothetical protein